jgi:hypothetical protein
MLLLRTPVQAARGPEVWTAQAQLYAEPDEVLRALTDPAMIADWAPIAFDVEGLAGGRLRTGSRARVSGTIAGVRATFEVEVLRADTQALELVANGPVSFEVTYRFRRRECGLLVDACVAVPRKGGLAGQLLRSATATLLNAGALRAALRRLERCVGSAFEPELVAA